MNIFNKRQLHADLRRVPRHELHFAAYIETPDRSPRHPCMIHDVSECGARLTVDRKTEIPDTFTLVFSRNCRVVRRAEDDSQIAVEFLPVKL